jgi:Mrp family chromosome partitioning ATPase
MSMERISKALDLAARQREARTTAPGNAIPGQMSQKHPDSGQDDHSRTATFFAPLVALDERALEREHILPPNAGGPNGSAYKLLRTQVLKRLDELKANTLAVLSPTASAGKTLTAINLAIAIAAEHGRTALLVDLDLRNPSIHTRFGFEPALGVEDCLNDDRPVQDAIVRVAGYERLALLPARSAVEHSSEMLSSERATRLVAELRARYANRIILFDMPPVLQADDALAFSRTVQAGLMVVGEGRTQRDDLARSVELLRDLTLVGTVLNGSREPAVPAY